MKTQNILRSPLKSKFCENSQILTPEKKNHLSANFQPQTIFQHEMAAPSENFLQDNLPTEFDSPLGDQENNFFDSSQLVEIKAAFRRLDICQEGQLDVRTDLENLLLELGPPLPDEHLSFLRSNLSPHGKSCFTLPQFLNSLIFLASNFQPDQSLPTTNPQSSPVHVHVVHPSCAGAVMAPCGSDEALLGMSPQMKGIPAYKNLRLRHQKLTEMYDHVVASLALAESTIQSLTCRTQVIEKHETSYKEISRQLELIKIENSSLVESHEKKTKVLATMKQNNEELHSKVKSIQDSLDEALQEIARLETKLGAAEKKAALHSDPLSSLEDPAPVCSPDEKEFERMRQKIESLREENLHYKDMVDEYACNLDSARKEAILLSKSASSELQKSTHITASIGDEILITPVKWTSPNPKAKSA
eukprot:Sdes_comp15390_c0_seq1m4269